MITPGSHGTYALVLHANCHKIITIGKLGNMLVMPGYYIYVGSALGSGGLKARLLHHCRLSSKPHWHMDYLRKVCDIQKIWLTEDKISRESSWVEVISGMSGVLKPLPGFGASDSKHSTHLFQVSEYPDIKCFIEELKEKISGHAPVSEISCIDISDCI